jgi:ABC transporter transmembrane region
MESQEAALQTDRASGTLRKIFAVYRWRILFTYGLFNLENIVRLAQPVALGLAIDGLLSSSYRGLLILIVQHLSHLLISLARQIYDTRAFTSIYTDIVSDIVLKQRQREVDVSSDELEREVGIIGSFEPQGVRNHYDMVARWRINLSNLAAANFGIMELFILSLIVVSIIRFSAMPDARPGDILAMFQYILMFVSGLDSVPMVVQQLSRLRDIERRIQLAASGEDEPPGN